MRDKRTTDANKGYPKRVLKKYGTSVPAPRTLVDNETTMNSKILPPGGSPAPAISTSAANTLVPANEQGNSVDAAPQLATKPDKRPEPQTTAEFIEAFYAGRTKVLSDSTVRRLKNAPVILEPSVRGDLLRRAMEVDDSLDKTRRLLVLATEVEELRALGHLLLQFAADVVLLHPAVKANGMQAHLFPPYGDEHTLEDAWRLLNASEVTMPRSTNAEKEPQAADVETNASSQALNEATTASEAASQRAKVVARLRAAQLLVAKVRRNALLCSVVWRVMHRKHLPLAEAMRALRGTLYAQGVEEPRLEAELLEALALMPEKEDAKVALLLQWTTKQQSDLVNKFAAGQSRIESLTEQVSRLEVEIKAGSQHVQTLKQQLEFERASKAELDRHIGVVKTHGEADYEELRAASLRSMRDAVHQLEQVSVALSRDTPKVPFAREVLETIVDSLRATTKKMEEL
jgi:hypothetical protein